jgi:hypothetical protein
MKDEFLNWAGETLAPIILRKPEIVRFEVKEIEPISYYSPKDFKTFKKVIVTLNNKDVSLKFYVGTLEECSEYLEKQIDNFLNCDKEDKNE